jgi:hypothetical protein
LPNTRLEIIRAVRAQGAVDHQSCSGDYADVTNAGCVSIDKENNLDDISPPQ